MIPPLHLIDSGFSNYRYIFLSKCGKKIYYIEYTIMGGLALQMYNVYVFKYDESRRRVENNQKMVYLCKVFFFQEACQNLFAQEERGRRLSVSLAYFFPFIFRCDFSIE